MSQLVFWIWITCVPLSIVLLCTWNREDTVIDRAHRRAVDALRRITNS